MYFNVFANKDLLLERVRTPSAPSATKRAALTTRKGGEYIVKVEAGAAKATLAPAAEAMERVASSTEGIPASGTSAGVEASGTKLVELFLLLGVG